jgi:hypothetical protein
MSQNLRVYYEGGRGGSSDDGDGIMENNKVSTEVSVVILISNYMTSRLINYME